VTTTSPANTNLPVFLEAWSFAPAGSDDAVSFAVGAVQSNESAPTWRLDLPSGTAASAALDAAEVQLLQSETALESVPDQLEALLHSAHSGTVSFAAAASPASADLLELLQRGGTPDLTSYGLFSRKQEKMEDAGRGFQDALQRLADMVSRMANIETSMQGRMVGRTRVGWDGHFETVFPAALLPEELLLHQRSINLALASRRLAISMIARTVQSAVKVAAYLATPGGALLALPAVWKFINGIINEVKTYQELKT
jgi:hypothetical protein